LIQYALIVRLKVLRVVLLVGLRRKARFHRTLLGPLFLGRAVR
jgi:hypothetical protein